LIGIKHQKALRYNDISVLENQDRVDFHVISKNEKEDLIQYEQFFD
jgi:hypothetical protein